MEELPEQRDIIDELLLQPAPPPEPPEPPPEPALTRKPEPPQTHATKPVVENAEDTADNAFGDSVHAAGPSRRLTSDTKLRRHLRHCVLTDCLIFKYVDVHGPRWRALARSLGGRAAGYSDDVVRNRYIRIMAANGTPYLPPSPRTTPPRKPDGPSKSWTPAEDATIATQLALTGKHWEHIAQAFGGSRTPHAVRNRANRLGLVLRVAERGVPTSHTQ